MSQIKLKKLCSEKLISKQVDFIISLISDSYYLTFMSANKKDFRIVRTSQPLDETSDD